MSIEEKNIDSIINGFKSEFNCSKCHNKQEVTLFPYINFNKNPEYYSLVKDLSIFKVKCEKCGHEELIKFDSLFVDETHKYFIYFLSDKSLYNKFKYQITYFIETILNKNNEYDLLEYKTRLVFNLNDIIEKMNIFELGLSDEAIELIKSGLYDKNLLDSSKYDVVLFDGMNNANLEFVAFNQKSSSVSPEKFNIDFKFYNIIIDEIKGIDARHKEYFEVIDLNWVRENFKK